MADKTRFLLGYGKKLDPVRYVSGFGDSVPPYSMQRQQQRLTPQLVDLDVKAAMLPKEATPGDQVVAVIRLHPAALSRSAFPDVLLQHSGLRMLGSRPAIHKPEAGRGSDVPGGMSVTDLFVAGTRENFQKTLLLLNNQQRFAEKDAIAGDFLSIENLRLMDKGDRVKSGISKSTDDLEIVLHYNATRDQQWRENFTKYARSVGVAIDVGLEFQRSDLLFMTASASKEAVEALANFSFMRAVRPLPVPRPLETPVVVRSSRPKFELPTEPAVDPKLRMAIFDGGFTPDHPFGKWVRAVEPFPEHDIGDPIPNLLLHGFAVTSAALFDQLTIGEEAPRPYCSIDHYRVLGENTERGKKGLYKALAFIDDVLSQSQYDIISLSIGPPDQLDEDRVSPWTTLLDDQLGNSNTLGFVAVGNVGEKPAPGSRVLAPSDSVNALAVGSCTAQEGDWQRAAYSAIGPGRHPGLIKPDVMYFGGTKDSPFLFAGPKNSLLKDWGTSFATPALARLSAGIRAHFGTKLSATAVRALLVHSAEDAGLPRIEVGFGRIPTELGTITICKPGSVRVVYQGKLRPGGMIRAPITVPKELEGEVNIRATASFSCLTDSNTPGEYTRAALEISFRPNCKKFTFDKKTKKYSFHPSTDTFFSLHDHLPEQERRLSGQKWNTVMHESRNKRASGLDEPCFDIHYVARAPGLSTSPGDAPELNYALVVTLSSKKEKNLYEKVLAEFPQVLAIEPTIALEIVNELASGS